MFQNILLPILLFLVAMLYSSVGHGGASGYLAVMSFFDLSTQEMKSSALLMNVLVSFISFYGFYKMNFFRWNKFWPFAISSIPAAYLGGSMSLNDAIYKKILGICLLFAVLRMLIQYANNEEHISPIKIQWALLIGSCIGFVSGLIGIGGGILLSPILLLLRWATIKETAAISALFKCVNSLSGFVGMVNKQGVILSNQLIIYITVALLGGMLGTYLGTKKLNIKGLKYVLAFGLLVASLKLILV
jgi:uncharacterized membrane protein YfcA